MNLSCMKQALSQFNELGEVTSQFGQGTRENNLQMLNCAKSTYYHQDSVCIMLNTS
jgi:hypothetical protein